MNELLKLKADSMIKTHDTIKNEYKWTSDELTRHFTALVYTLGNKGFNLQQFQEMQKYMKDTTGIFSHYRSHEKFTVSSLLITRFDNPKEAFNKIMEYEIRLSREGFSKGPYLAIAAFALLITCPPERIDERILRMREIYKEMRQEHFWLTGQDDYPLAALIASGEKDNDGVIREIENYYNMLHEEGLVKSNGLQQLSHMLTFSSEAPEIKVKRCRAVFDYFKERKVKIYTPNYSLLGLVALMGDKASSMLDEIMEVYSFFKAHKSFRYVTKQLILLMSCALVCSSLIDDIKQDKGLIETSIGITIEALIAAQTAAIIASTAAATSIAASSASSS